MKLLLKITTIIEGLTGLALISMPVVTVSLLLGTSLTEPGGKLLGRVGGAALISLALACWQARKDEPFSLAMIKAMLFYNFAAGSLLLYARFGEKLSGMGLWPAVSLHTGLLVWCLVLLQKDKKRTGVILN
jgi:peptidoglycan/LPS O-acetylase OafA/YrhL